MRIVCPTCDAIYEVPDRLLAGGKRTRCARCAREWVPEPAAGPTAETPAASAPEPPLVIPPPPVRPIAPPAPPVPRPEVRPAARPELRVEPRPAGSRMPVAVALGVSVIVLAGLLAAGVQWRAQAIQAWPPVERLYVWLGLK